MEEIKIPNSQVKFRFPESVFFQMARTKQTRRLGPSASLVTASGLPLALREDVNFGNIEGEHAADPEATAEEEDCVNEESLIPMDEEENLEAESALDEVDADDDEPESEGAKVSPEEWAKEPTEEELAKFVTMLPAWASSCDGTGYTGPIPKGFTQDISKLQDCGNPRHFIDDITEKYRCRWCGHNFSKSSAKVRREKGCDVIGAPGHKWDIHCHNPAIGLNCVGAGVYTPDKDNDGRKGNSKGNIARLSQTSKK
uniref:Uncharacterized protein n=1 Tax=Tetranychus urticae TaxID=32264 RepID=T1JQP8_TETUR